MLLKIKHFVLYVTICCFLACKEKPLQLTEITAKQLAIDSLVRESDSIRLFLVPFKTHIDKVLDSALAFAPYMITKQEGEFNTAAGNLIADIILGEASPVFKARTGNEIDFALMNHGGIRSIISKGNVTARNAFEVMPFENAIAVVELKGSTVNQLAHFLAQSKIPHPIAGLQIIVDNTGTLKQVLVKGKAVDLNRNYFVATSDYLVAGGDKMVFFKEAVSITEIDYKIRNAIIDHLKKVDNFKPVIDDRFYKLKP